VRFLRSLARGIEETLTGWSSPAYALEAFVVAPFVRESRWRRALRRAGRARRERTWRRRAARGGTLWFGPFFGEVGYELTYWAPFVRGFARRIGLDPARVGVISRGGVGSWYGPGVAYREIFDRVDAGGYRALQDDTYPIGTRRVEREFVRGLGIPRRRIVHPKEMQLEIAPFRGGDEGLDALRERMVYRALRRDELLADRDLAAAWAPIARTLPDRYACVKVYGGGLMSRDEALERVGTLVASLSSSVAVVALDIGVRVDGHADRTATGSGISRPLAGAPLRLNLGLQSLVVAGAACFVSSYGGISYLGPLLGVPTMVLADGAKAQKPAHMLVEDHLAALGGSPYRRLDVSTNGWDEALAAFVRHHAGGSA
jgi:hypothetical protein